MFISSLVFGLLELRFPIFSKFTFSTFVGVWLLSLFVCVFACVCFNVLVDCVCLVLELHIDVHLVFGFGLLELRCPMFFEIPL